MDFVNGINRDQLIIMDFETKVAYDFWAMMVYNLRRLMSIFSINELIPNWYKSKVKEPCANIYSHIQHHISCFKE